jgi:hypothetical protein
MQRFSSFESKVIPPIYQMLVMQGADSKILSITKIQLHV